MLPFNEAKGNIFLSQMMIKYVAFRFIEINDMKESDRVYFIFGDSSRAVGFIIVLCILKWPS